jgi:uncharacterized protein YdhG (YjbR/CyaY superfamily)
MKKGEFTPVAKTVDEYIAVQPKKNQEALLELRAAIRQAAPKAEEVISYQIPSYKLNGALVHFASFENHCSFFVVNKNILKEYAQELENYKTSGTTIHFSSENPIPKKLVQKIVKQRVVENTERTPAKKKAKTS